MTTTADRYGTNLDPDPSLSVDDNRDPIFPPPIASTRQSVVDRPVITTDNEIRCQGKVEMANGTHKVCNKLLANMASRPWEIVCQRCKSVNQSATSQSAPLLGAPGPAPTPAGSAE